MNQNPSLGCLGQEELVALFYSYIEQDLIEQALGIATHLDKQMDKMTVENAHVREIVSMYQGHTELTKQRIIMELPAAKYRREYELLVVYYQILSRLCSRQQQYEQAVQYAKMAVLFARHMQASPYAQLAHWQQLLSLLDDGKGEAVQQYVNAQIPEASSEHPFWRTIEATVLLQQGQSEQALTLYEGVIRFWQQQQLTPMALTLLEHIARQLPTSAHILASNVAQLLQPFVIVQGEIPQMYETTPLFIKAGQHLFNERSATHSICCVWIQLEGRAATLQQWGDLLKQHLELAKAERPYVWTSLNEGTFVFVTASHSEQQLQEGLWEEIFSINKQLNLERSAVQLVLGNQ